MRSLETHKLRQGCKRRAADDPFERPSKITNMELQAGSADIQEILPRDVHTVRRALYRERRKHTPKLPKTREETHQCIDDVEMQSSRGENMVLVNDRDTGIVIFATRSNLEFLCSEGVLLFGDGTFQFCPKTVHAPWMQKRSVGSLHVLPVAR
ncbi:hypothetical protein ACOMHN_028994 [Nucella lapillus]